jgi:hypothetical protein
MDDWTNTDTMTTVENLARVGEHLRGISAALEVGYDEATGAAKGQEGEN